MKRYHAIIILTGLAHLLAWFAMLWLALWPAAYRGVSVTAVTPGEVPGEATSVSSSLIEVNGLWVLLLLAVPVALTALGLWAVLRMDAGHAASKGLLWASALFLLLFCLVGMFTIGLFYLPAALALMASALVASRRSPYHATSRSKEG